MSFDSSGRIASQDFDYAAIDGEQAPNEEELQAAIAAFEKLLAWIWQCGPKNNNGIEIRAVICCWIFLKQLRPLTLTQVSAVVGRDKQSLGRWFDEFKRDMPEIKTCHMKNT